MRMLISAQRDPKVALQVMSSLMKYDTAEVKASSASTTASDGDVGGADSSVATDDALTRLLNGTSDLPEPDRVPKSAVGLPDGALSRAAKVPLDRKGPGFKTDYPGSGIDFDPPSTESTQPGSGLDLFS